MFATTNYQQQNYQKLYFKHSYAESALREQHKYITLTVVQERIISLCFTQQFLQSSKVSSLYVQIEFVLSEMQVWLVLVNCVTHNWNLNENYSSLNQKQTLLYLIQSPECWKSHFRALKFQTFVREHGPRPPQRYGINGPLLIQSGILFKPAGYLNHY